MKTIEEIIEVWNKQAKELSETIDIPDIRKIFTLHEQKIREEILAKARAILDQEEMEYGTSKHGLDYEQLVEIVNGK